jgi:hypothetical protein
LLDDLASGHDFSRADALAIYVCQSGALASIRAFADGASAESKDTFMNVAFAFGFYTSAMNVP